MKIIKENRMNSVNPQTSNVVGNTEPSLEGCELYSRNLFEGVTTISAIQALGLAETLEVAARTTANSGDAPVQRAITTGNNQPDEMINKARNHFFMFDTNLLESVNDIVCSALKDVEERLVVSPSE